MIRFGNKIFGDVLKKSSNLGYPLKFTSKSKNLIVYSKMKILSLNKYENSVNLIKQLVEMLLKLIFFLL